MSRPIPIRSQPGVKRDGTRLEGGAYIDANWCRWQRGLPRKMGGFYSTARDLPQRVYGMNSFAANASHYFLLGSAEQLQQRIINSMGAVIGASDRTPAGLVTSADNIWTLDYIFNLGAVNDTVVVAHAAPNMDIASTADRDIFYGVVTDSGILLTSGQDQVSGGVIVVGNYVVGFGSGGYVQWSAANDVTVATLDAGNFTQQKIVAGRRVRGGGVPAALLWSLDSLLLMSFNAGGTPIWDFDTVTDETSILSSRSIIEYDGIFYWLGVDRFLAYNGVVREVPNQMNANYFFDNLNFEQRQKVYAYKVPRFGEIWWCYPHGDSDECNRAIILNVRENTWYDTELPGEGRTDGLYAKVYFKPFMMGAEQTLDGFDLWQHETGKNAVRLASTQPIPSHFETHEIALLQAEQDPSSHSLSVGILEPDFVQSGDLEIQVNGRSNARAPLELSDPQTITESASDATEQVARFKEMRRLMSFKVSSNAIDGDYQMGSVYAHVEQSDARITT